MFAKPQAPKEWVDPIVAQFEQAHTAIVGTSDDPDVLFPALAAARACRSPNGSSERLVEAANTTVTTSAGPMTVSAVIKQCEQLAFALEDRPVRGCAIITRKFSTDFIAGGGWSKPELLREDSQPHRPHLRVLVKCDGKLAAPPASTAALTDELRAACGEHVQAVTVDDWKTHTNQDGIAVNKTAFATCYYESAPYVVLEDVRAEDRGYFEKVK